MSISIDRWTEADLQALIGQSESSRLEFKSGRMFDQDRDKWSQLLSIEASAFANSEGGTLVLGMAERKEGKTPVAASLDGIPVEKLPMPWLQQILESNLSPYLPGVRLRAIPLTGELTGRICVILSIPAGTTAYQAQDRRYYGRSEFQVQPLPDHEVRLRMQRGKTPKAEVAVCFDTFSDLPPIGSDEAPNSGGASKERLLTLPGLENHYFALMIRNTGDVTIRDFALEVFVRVIPEVDVAYNGRVVGRDHSESGRFLSPEGARLFPAEYWRFPQGYWTLAAERLRSIEPGDVVIEWRLLLDNAPPTDGVIDVGEALAPVLDAEVWPGDAGRSG